MAEPPPPPPATMTVTIAVPMLANIFQSVHNIEREVTNLRADFSTRLEALEAQLQLARQSTIQSPPNLTAILSHDIVDNTISAHEDSVHQEEDRIDDASLHVQMDDRFRRDDFAHTQQDDIIQEDENITQEDTRTQEMDSSHEDAVTSTYTYEDRESPAREDGQSVLVSSSPSVDVGITVIAKPVVLAPAAVTASGRKKRKRTLHDIPAHIDRLGFMVRSSDAQLAKKRNGEAKGPSRSKSPFNNNDRHDSLDGVDEIPPKPPTGI